MFPIKAFCLHGDACDEQSYVKLLSGRHAKLLLTDPPYCLLTRRRRSGDLRDPKGRKIDRDPVVRFETTRDYRIFTENWLTLATAHLDNTAPLIIWTNFLGKEPIMGVARTLGYAHCAGEFVWAKRSKESTGNEQLLRVYEVALVLMRHAQLAPQPESLPTVWSVVAGYDDDGEAARWNEHPHHKPWGVMETLVRTYSKVGDLILDPFAGSGSIPSAALRLHRRIAAIEKESAWAEITNRRLAELV